MALSAQESWEKNRDHIMAIPDDRVMAPSKPREDIVGEAEELRMNASNDREALVVLGMNPVYIDTLDERIGAFAFTSSVRETTLLRDSEALNGFRAKQGPATEFRTDLLADMGFAIRKDKELKKVLGRIVKGKGYRDLVLDLLDCERFGRKNEEYLKAINFDMTRLDQAKDLHDELSDLLAEANTSPQELNELKQNTFKSYTWLKEATDEIREYGQHAFRKDPERLNRYKSDYYQKLGRLSHAIDIDSNDPTEKLL